MATNQSSAAQERQLILVERMNRRLDSILEGQKKLEETNSNLQLENMKLKNELAKQERVMKSKRASKSRESSVEIPNDLKVKYIIILIF